MTKLLLAQTVYSQRYTRLTLLVFFCSEVAHDYKLQFSYKLIQNFPIGRRIVVYIFSPSKLETVSSLK